MARIILLAVLLQLPSLAFAASSPLKLECSAEQSLPGRALVCEYFMLDRLNAQLVQLHDRVVAAGRAGRIEVKRWLAARDACQDVECLDRLYEAGMREAKLALVDVESRKPALILTNARGDLLRVAEKQATPAPLPFEVKAVQEAPVRERSSVAVYVALALLAVAVAYGVMARRLSV